MIPNLKKIGGASGPSSTVLMHFEGTSGTATFTDVYGHSFSSAAGSTTISNAQAKFGSCSLSLNGSNQGIHALPSGTEFDLQTDFTLEGFLYYNTVSTAVAQCFVSRDDGGGATNKWGIGLNVLTAGKFSIHRNYAGTQRNLEWTWSPTVSTWYHVAFTYDHTDGLYSVYVNGVNLGMIADIYTLPVPGTDKNLALGFLEEGAWYTNGYIDEFRLSPLNRYSYTFTPPSSAFSSGSHLIQFDGTAGSTTFTDAGSNAVSVTAGGTGAVETSQVKFGSGALACGTQAGWATLANSADQEFGTGDFTIECWAYLTAVPTSGQTQATLCAKNPNSPQVDAFQVGVNTGGALFFFLSSHTGGGWDTQISGPTSSFPLNTWVHVVAQRFKNNVTIFQNGSVVVTGTANFSLYSNTSSLIRVGTYDGNGDYGWIGYVDSFRITNSALYTGNFTPPASPFTF
jgi:hypothetical protein